MFCKLHWEQNNSQSFGRDHEDHWAHQSSPCYVISHKLIHSSYQLQERCINTLLQGRKVHRLPKVTALTNGRAGTESKPCGFSSGPRSIRAAQSAHINHGFKLGFAEDRGGSVALSALSSQSYGFSSGHVWMWELDYKESWAPKNWSFEQRCWRRLLRVPWTARRSNQSMLMEISPEYSLEGLMLKLKLQYLGHLMRRTDSLEKTLMLGNIEGQRRRGQQNVVSWITSYFKIYNSSPSLIIL